MKKGLLFISALSLLSVFGCVDEVHQPEDAKEVKVSVSLASVLTRTYLGEIEGNTRKVCWSVGDAVNVNGYESLPLTDQQAGRASAEFMLYNGTAPFSVIYPASIYQGKSADGMVSVKIPATQEYSATSFGKGAAVLYGYGESADVPVSLNNLCAAVKVTLNSAEDSISMARIISNSKSAPIAGDFSIDPKTGEYTVTSGLTTVSLNIAEVSLTEDDSQSFYFTVPYGTYAEGFTVKFYDAQMYPMECVWKPADGVVSAGKLYEFKPVDFVPGKKEILTGDDWKYIAEQINAGETEWKAAYLDGNTIRLGDDIVISADAPQIKSFPYELDGKGFSITNLDATGALINTLPAGGVIRNLTMAGEMKTPDATKTLVEVAAFVHTISGGKIEDCVNEMVFKVDSKRVKFGTFAVMAKAGELWGCVNNADVTIKMDIKSFTSGDVPAYGAGLIAACEDPEDIINITGCTNNGDVVITLDNNKSGISKAGFAGIIGFVSGAVTDKYPKLVDCTNNGHVSLSFVMPDTLITKAQYSVGGIVGFSASLEESATDNKGKVIPVKYSWISDTDADHSYICLENCMNTGNIRNNTTSAGSSEEYQVKVYTGGIAGTLLGLSTNHAKIINCKNTGDVVPYSVKANNYTRASICGVCGGFLGLGGYVDIEGGVMNAKVGTAESRSFATAGVIGLAVGKFSVKNMSVNANISMIQSSDITENNHALAVTNSTKVIKSDLAGSEISNCAFSGSFLTICSGKYNSVPVIPTEIKYVTAADFKADGTVTPGVLISRSYTKGGITMTGNTYWSNVNEQ